MKNLFVNSDEKVDIIIYSYIDAEKGEMYISDSKEQILKKNIAEDQIKSNTIVFRVPNYGDNSLIYGNSVRIENGAIHVDPIALRRNKMVTLIKDWDFKNSDGEPLTLNLENINKMQPALADLIIDELEKKIG